MHILFASKKWVPTLLGALGTQRTSHNTLSLQWGKSCWVGLGGRSHSGQIYPGVQYVIPLCLHLQHKSLWAMASRLSFMSGDSDRWISFPGRKHSTFSGWFHGWISDTPLNGCVSAVLCGSVYSCSIVIQIDKLTPWVYWTQQGQLYFLHTQISVVTNAKVMKTLQHPALGAVHCCSSAQTFRPRCVWSVAQLWQYKRIEQWLKCRLLSLIQMV